jgi:oligopeptide transport system ATP-binding protein
MATTSTTAPTLTVDNISVGFRRGGTVITAVHDVSFFIRPGETLALVGESGSGKSVTNLAIMRLIPPAPRTLVKGSALLACKDGVTRDLIAANREQIRAIRGNEIAMIFQEPMTSLNPVHTVGDQIAEAILLHREVSRRRALDDAAELLSLVGIPDASRRLSSYPHHLSGGMRQRVMIAMAISCQPRVVVADEPTTALDVTVQAQILELLKRLQEQTGMAIIFITHNLGVVAEVADRVMVMYGGRLVEQADVGPLFARPLMPYTAALLNSVPRMDMAGRRDSALDAIQGAVPDPSRLPTGCSFHPRCHFHVGGRCDVAQPPLEAAGEGRAVRCLRWREIWPA